MSWSKTKMTKLWLKQRCFFLSMIIYSRYISSFLLNDPEKPIPTCYAFIIHEIPSKHSYVYPHHWSVPVVFCSSLRYIPDGTWCCWQPFDPSSPSTTCVHPSLGSQAALATPGACESCDKADFLKRVLNETNKHGVSWHDLDLTQAQACSHIWDVASSGFFAPHHCHASTVP
jgi:hypothetical protein